MATAAQIAANRENAQLSTGPRTEQGKLTAAQNARSHGLTGRFCILPGEDPAEFEALLAALLDEHAASTPSETFLVTEMAQAQWKLRRITEMEFELWWNIDLKPTGAMERAFKRNLTGDSTDTRPLAVRFSDDCAHNQVFMKLMRYEETARRTWHKALNQLQKLRQEDEKLENLRQSRLAKQADEEANRLLAQALTPPVVAPSAPVIRLRNKANADPSPARTRCPQAPRSSLQSPQRPEPHEQGTAEVLPKVPRCRFREHLA